MAVEPTQEIIDWIDSPGGVLLMEDAARFASEHKAITRDGSIDVIEKWRRCFSFYPEFRTLTDYRLGHKRTLPEMERCPALYILCKSIGGGFFLQHGFATIIRARSIGSNFHINQNVTIGSGRAGGSPIIGNNVTIRTGAVVVGPIRIGDGAHIGANAVVNFDVPPGAHVVAARSQIVMPKER
jgi:acetyltransferase-like isoleucine patch superfamily enzyme